MADGTKKRNDQGRIAFGNAQKLPKLASRSLTYRFFVTIALISIFAVALYARIVFVAFETPYVSNADEHTNMNVVLAMLRNSTADPGFFRYPSLSFYLQLPGQFLASAWFEGPAEISSQSFGSGRIDNSAALIFARATTVVVGIALLVAAAMHACWMGIGRLGQFVIVAALAICPLLVRHSSYVTPDILAGFCTTMCLAFVAGSGLDPKKLFIAAGWAGLAASAKYNAGLVAISIPVAVCLAHGFSRKSLVSVIALGGVALLSFAISSPYVFLDTQKSVADILFELRHYAQGHAGAEGESLRMNAMWLVDQTGLFLFALFALPLTNWRKALPLTVFIVVYFLLLSMQTVRFERNLIPILPALIILAVYCFSAIVKRSHWIVYLLAILACLGPAGRTLDLLGSYDRDPNRAARIWLNETISKEQTVLLDAYSPYLDQRSTPVVDGLFVLRDSPNLIEETDVVVLTRKGSDRFLRNKASAEFEYYSKLEKRACKTSQFPGDRDNDWQIKVFWNKCP